MIFCFERAFEMRGDEVGTVDQRAARLREDATSNQRSGRETEEYIGDGIHRKIRHCLQSEATLSLSVIEAALGIQIFVSEKGLYCHGALSLHGPVGSAQKNL